MPKSLAIQLRFLREIFRRFGGDFGLRFHWSLALCDSNRAILLRFQIAASASLRFGHLSVEDIKFVAMNDGEFHDHPDSDSQFVAECTVSWRRCAVGISSMCL